MSDPELKINSELIEELYLISYILDVKLDGAEELSSMFVVCQLLNSTGKRNVLSSHWRTFILYDL